jgi:gp16 family phage-associated protein
MSTLLTIIGKSANIHAMNDKQLRTVEEARAWLDRHGVSVSEWARAHDFRPTVVFSVLSGRTRGRRGQAHRVAVALQIKETASASELNPLADVKDNLGANSHFVGPNQERGLAMT